jgi:hypothetical protein
MNKGPTIVLVLLFAAACVGISVFMPWAELGLPTSATAIPEPAKSVLSAVGMSGIFDGLGGLKEQAAAIVKSVPSHDTNFAYYVYSVFLALAMTAAALAILIVGKEDAEEKTILPEKK